MTMHSHPQSNPPGSPVPPASTRGMMITTIVLGVVILVPSMVGFVNKLIEFVHATSSDADGAYVLTPLINYLLASIGFFLLLLGSTARGMFHDLEGPKRTMLAREAELDAEEPEYIPPWAGGRVGSQLQTGRQTDPVT